MSAVSPCIDWGGYRKYAYLRSDGKFHLGHDFNCAKDSVVNSILDGEVYFEGKLPGFGGSDGKWGSLIIIKHLNRKEEPFLAIYGHVIAELNKGDYIAKGKLVGRVHSYFIGDTDYPHLHFGIYLDDNIELKNLGYYHKFGKWTNPRAYMKDYC